MFIVLKCWKSTLQVRNYAKKAKEMKYLNVAEKNDAAKTIAGLLSNGTSRRREGYSVYNKIYDFETTVKGTNSKMVMTSVSGHLLHLEFFAAYRNWKNIDPKALFEAPVRKACSQDYQPIKRTLEREVRGCQGLIIWTDCDREGENIGFEIIEVCRAIKPNIPVYRAVFSEITTASVRRALQRLATPDKLQSEAVDVRTELDLRTGAALTRFQTMRLQRLFPAKIADKLISYGSCQIPTLGFVVERYKEVEAFVSEPFWKIKVTHTIDELTVEFSWARNRLFDKAACEDYLLLCLADPKATVESVTVKPKNKWRPTPMDTVQLEKLGSRKLKLSAKETMTIAEKLYTRGIISYPRTETNQFSKEIDLRSLVEQQTSHTDWGAFAQRVMEWGPNPRNGNKSDQAHPPIHPTKMVPNLQGAEARVYELICRHFLACVSKDAVGSETVVHINIAGEKFTATGLCIFERNYLDVYIYEKWNAKQIHRYEEGQVFDPTEISMQEGATTAPPLLTEADLIALMEKHGIGTDATHADHINTIKERGYIGVVDNGCLVPGVIGMGLWEGYDAMQLSLAKPQLRAEFEVDLKKICAGEKDPQVVLREQVQKYKLAYSQIMDKVSAMDEKIALRINEAPLPSANADSIAAENSANHLQQLFQCPKCNVTPLALKPKKNQSGHYIGCLSFPDCKNVIWWPDECKEPSVLDETCSTCGSQVKLIKLKFNSAYYKTLFNAPNGWYKTCLRCDSNFRNAFNINLESVKRAGNIVSDAAAAAAPRGNVVSAAPGSSGVAHTTTAPRTGRLPSGDGTTARGKKTNTNKPKSDVASKASTKTIKKTSTVTNSTNTGSNIRSYFTSATTSNASTPESVSEIVAAQLNDAALQDFFDSNDGFDDLILAADINPNPTVSHNSRNENTTTQHSNSNWTSDSAPLSADIAAAFNDDDDDDDVFANFKWGTSESTAASSSTSNNTATNHARNTNSYTQRNNTEASFSAPYEATDYDLESMPWGRAQQVSHTSFSERSTTSSPAAKRACLQGRDNSFNRSTPPAADTVKCSGCKQVAKQLTAKRDGPNKGRQFFICPKSDACKFFQWEDELETAAGNSQERAQARQTQSSNDSWGSRGNRIPTSNNNNYNAANTEEVAVDCNCGVPAKSLTVRKEGPNTGRSFYACANRDKSCKFFQWEDELETAADNSQERAQARQTQSSNDNWGSRGNRIPTSNNNNYNAANTEEVAVDCNCGVPAKSLTVRKEGPNTGRPFYACANSDKSCKFFKWGDEIANDEGASTSSAAARQQNYATSRNSGQNNYNRNANGDEQRGSKARKCGLCRQEGHTRQKCPRKAEFEF